MLDVTLEEAMELKLGMMMGDQWEQKMEHEWLVRVLEQLMANL